MQAPQEHQLKLSLQPGIKYEHRFVLPTTKTVPALYPEAAEFLAMPEVLPRVSWWASWSGLVSKPSTRI